MSIPASNRNPLLWLAANKPGYLPFEEPMYKDSPARVKKLPPIRMGAACQKNGFEHKIVPKKNWAIKAV